jgi:acyl-coenzyme A synthetase/AMP-(fatty) acid ligase
MHGLLTDRDRFIAHPAAPILAALQSYRGEIVDLEEGVRVGGAELRSAVDAVAKWLAKLGVSTGDRVVFSVGNGPAFTAALCGALAAGASPILLHGETPPQELLRYARQYSARFALSQCSLGSLPSDGESYRAIVAPVGESQNSSLPEWLELYCTEFALDPHGPTFPSVIGATLHPTSGTTGEAKIAVRTAEQTFEEARHYIKTMQITRRDRILCVVPMSHAYGFGMGFMVSLLSGASLFTMRQFNPRTIPRVLTERQITIFPAVPAMLDLVLRADVADVAIPRLVLAAGAPLAEATAAAFLRQTGTPIT